MRLGSASREEQRGRPSSVLPTCVVLGMVVMGCSASGSYQYRWEFFFDSVLHPDGFILSGIWLTVSIAVTSQIIGVILGVFGALGKQAKRRGIRWFANFYVWIFRGTPLLVQISLHLLRTERAKHLHAGRTSTSSGSPSPAPSRPASSRSDSTRAPT